MLTSQTLYAGAVVALLAAALPAFQAHAVTSKCDAAITKAAGKKASCKASVYATAYAKDLAPDAVKLAKCEAKFDALCQKAKLAADCVVQTQPCDTVQDAVDACVADVVDNTCGSAGGFCWLLGDAGQTCTAVCAAEGMVYDSATESYAGSGGSDANCNQVLDSVGAPAATFVSANCALSSVACHYDELLVIRVRCTNAGAEGNSYANGRRACACKAVP